jgi:PAS domain S-box-containing protein
VSDRGERWESEADELVAAVLQATAQPVWVVDPDGLIRFANRAAIAVLGYDSADELLGLPSHETIHYRRPDGSMYPPSECPMLLPRTTGETVSSELDWFFRRDGSMFPVSYVSVAIDLPEGRGAVVAFSDIEERRRAEQHLREREARLTEQQEALQRVAALVAGDTDSVDVFAAVAREVGQVLQTPLVQMSRYEPDGTETVIGAWSERPHPFQAGKRWALEGPTISMRVRETGQPARLDNLNDVPGALAEAVRRAGIGSVAGAPIVVNGRVWGVMATGSVEGQRLSAGIEHRLAEFTELVASAIANAQAREDLERIADEQAALRRVATIVAEGAPPEEVFSLVAQEIARVTGLELIVIGRFDPGRVMTSVGAAGEHPYQPGTRWPLDGGNVSSQVLETGRPVTIDSYAEMSGTIAEAAHAAGIRDGVGAPIIVDGHVWGTVSAGGTARVPLPTDIKRRLTQFTALIATAISKTQASEELRLLAEEQSVLRRVATLVAQAAPPADVFAAVAAEVSVVLDLPLVEMCRYETDGTATVVGAVGDHPFQTGTNWALDGPSLTAQVKRTGRPARVDDYASVPGSIGDAARATGVHAGVGAPIVVDGKVWGVVSAGGGARVPVPPGAEARLSQFTELVATAISNSQAREDLQRLADEQASLHRLATLVAEGAESRVVFDAVAEETGRLLGPTTVNLVHFTPDAMNVTISGWSVRGVHVLPGTRLPIDGDSINAIILRTARPARCDTYEGVAGQLAAHLRRLGIRSEVGAPVVVEGHIWGALIAGTDKPEPLASRTEYRLAEFAELIATAVSNAQARQDLRRVVDEQAALRRIATLVAEGAQSQLVFDAVCEETGRLFGAATVNLVYFTPDDFHLAMSGWSLRGVHVPTGTLLPLEGDTIDTLVQRTAAPGRCDSYEHAQGEIAALLRQLGVRSEVGAPVVVDGQVWGVLIAGTDEAEPLPPGTEHRLAGFAELIATTVSNTTARSELIASRARIVAAGDEQRRRVVRDLHDGAQQRLVHAVITLQLAQGENAATPQLARLVGEALDDSRRAIEELRELAHGLHPAVLTARGLAAAVEELADRAPVPVHIDIPDQRYPAVVESAAYFIATEALTNVAKYANASAARVTVTASRNALVLTIDDDGAGGAVAKPGSGLSGLLDRVAALDGMLTVESLPGAGTRIRAELPLSTGASDEPDSLRATAPIPAPISVSRDQTSRP